MPITLTVGDNTYATVQEADDYFEKYGNTDWAALDEDDRAQALVTGTQAVDLLYGGRYLGCMASDSQALLFPRQSFIDRDGRTVTGIPKALKAAVAELALMASQGENILPEPSMDAGLTSHSVAVGEIQETKTWGKLPDTVSYEGMNKVELLLRPLLRSKSTANFRITG